MKIIDRAIKIRIKVNIIDINNKQYIMVKRYAFFYLISLVMFVNVGIISIFLMALPVLFNINVKWIIFSLVIVNLFPILIFGLIPKRKKYIEIKRSKLKWKI